jgi:hypothetical protein
MRQQWPSPASTNHHKVPTLHSPLRLVLLFIPAVARNSPLPTADFRTTICIRQRKLRASEICVILERARGMRNGFRLVCWIGHRQTKVRVRRLASGMGMPYDTECENDGTLESGFSIAEVQVRKRPNTGYTIKFPRSLTIINI